MVKDLNDPTNVDSVPAILTPGEFVLNKEATAMYGPLIEQMNEHGLQQRRAENEAVKANVGKKISKLHGEGYTAPGQAYAIAKDMGYNRGGKVDPFDKYFDKLLKHEGGWSDHAADRGGKTNLGITLNTLRSVKPNATAEDLRNLTKEEAKQIYRKNYYEGPGIDKLPEHIREQVFDIAVNSGPARAKKMLNQVVQQAGGDISKVDNNMLADRRQQFYDGLVKNNPSQQAFIKGWTNRANSFRTDGKKKKPAPPPPTEAPPKQAAPQVQTETPQAPPQEADKSSTDSFGFRDAVDAAVGMALQPSAPIQHQQSIMTRSPTQPRYIPLVKKGKIVQSFNQGGWLDWRGLDGQGLTLGQKLGQGTIWGIDEEEKRKRREALARRPGIRPAPPQATTASPSQPQTVPAMDNTPPVPFSDEAILQGSSQSLENNENIASLPIGDPTRVAAIEAGEFEPTDADFDWDEQRWRTDEALRQAQLQQAVTAPDAPGAEFIDSRVQSLQDQMTNLGVPPESQGVGVDTVPAVDPSVPPQTPPGLGLSPNEVGAVPGLDTTAPNVPTPQEAADVVDPDAQDPRKEGTSEQKHKAKPPAEAIKTAQTVIENQGEEPPAELTQTPTQEIVKSAEQAVQKEPGLLQDAMSSLKDAFGDLFDGKELRRMGLLFAGAMLTGSTPGQALSFAGTSYIARVDAKATNKQKYQQDLVKSGKYTPASIEAYLDSNDPSQLIPTEELGTMEELGNQQEFYDKSGNRITAREVKIGDSKYWVDGQGRPINLNNVHQEASRVPGTDEYNKRVHDESKTYTKAFEEMQERFGTFGEGQDKTYATDLLPGKVGLNAAKWANKNGVPPQAMGQLLDNAYQSAIAEANMTGKKPRSIEAYLNEQYIKSEVGDPSLFQTPKGQPADASKVNELMSIFHNQLSGLPAYQGLSKTAISTRVVQAARQEWNALDPEIKETYERRAGPGQSAFMVYLTNEVSKP